MSALAGLPAYVEFAQIMGLGRPISRDVQALRDQIIGENDAARTGQGGERSLFNKNKDHRPKSFILKIAYPEIGDDPWAHDGFPFFRQLFSIPFKGLDHAAAFDPLGNQQLILSDGSSGGDGR